MTPQHRHLIDFNQRRDALVRRARQGGGFPVAKPCPIDCEQEESDDEL